MTKVITHHERALKLLKEQIGNDSEVSDIANTAKKVQEKWINPVGKAADETNGLIYGLVQSGKTGVLTATAALAADEGYNIVIILTSDIDPLYDQTLSRARDAFPGFDILGKTDIAKKKDFVSRVANNNNSCAIVVTKNAALLKTLALNLRSKELGNLSALIIDDEADQATPNTRASKDDGSRSKINECLENLRGNFVRNTYLQVTATPQALFLQPTDNSIRPKFTVLSHPGADYVGGNDFFCDGSQLVRIFPLEDINEIAPGKQPLPRKKMPSSLIKALDTFMVAATFKYIHGAGAKSAFLCHVSTSKSDHKHIYDLLRKYKDDLSAGLRKRDAKTLGRLRNAFDDLAQTDPDLASADFSQIVGEISSLTRGALIKIVNGDTDEDVILEAVYNLFVGGNKLGRGVTIKNLLVSYYGRNPKAPQADTVLQHARMYGYRRKDKGLLRLFLPHELNQVFKAINIMEGSLRDLIASREGEEFRGVYLRTGVNPTRKNILVPGAIGVYTGGKSYNPSQIVRKNIFKKTEAIDEILKNLKNKEYGVFSLAEFEEIINNIQSSDQEKDFIWDNSAIVAAVQQTLKIEKKEKLYIFVDRDRDISALRRETQGILSDKEADMVPRDMVTLFLLRTKTSRGSEAAWWPQVRFPNNKYAFAFAI